MNINGPVPEYVQLQHFNLWISTKNSKAPLLAADLIELCKQNDVNWVALGCMSITVTEWFTKLDDGLFGYGKGFNQKDEIEQALAKLLGLDTWNKAPSKDLELADKIFLLYRQFLSFSMRMAGQVKPEPIEVPKPAEPVKPVEPAKPAPQPVEAPKASEPTPAPVPAPVEPKKSPVTVVAKIAASVLAVMSAVGFFAHMIFPDSIDKLWDLIVQALKVLSHP